MIILTRLSIIGLPIRAEANATYGHIRDWNVQAVTNMANAFANRTGFDENLGDWDVNPQCDQHAGHV